MRARKKLMVATAPGILLMDAHAGGLTPPEIDEFIALRLRQKGQRPTLVFIEHALHFPMSDADRAVMMHHGQVISDGSRRA